MCGWCGKQELRIKHLGRDPGAVPLWSCRAGRLALRDSSEVGSGNWHLVLQAEQRGNPQVSPLAQTSGRQDRDKQLQSQGEAAPHHCRVGQGSFPELSFQQGPRELVFREQGFWDAERVAP